jgi:predicted ABC-type ATPase
MDDPSSTYVEGYVNVGGVPIAHAWTVDSFGHLHDPTLTDGKGIKGYFGVPFDREYVRETALKTGVYGILSHTNPSIFKADPSEFVKKAAFLIKFKEPSFLIKFNENHDERGLFSSGPSSSGEFNEKDVAKRMAAAEARLESIPPTDKIDTPERHALRETVGNEFYAKEVEGKVQGHKAEIILGLPGSGKSTLINARTDDGYANIDNDKIKAMLPEWNDGIGASALHEEASGISRTLRNRAIAKGVNLVWERVDSPDKITKDIASLRRAGYDVDVKLVDVPIETAVNSATTRFMKTGRYVSPAVIRGYGTTPIQSYELARDSGLVNSAERYRRSVTGRGLVRVE